VIVDGATGGVGSIAIAALARLGYHVVALTGKESESDWLKKLGAKEVKLRSSIDFQKPALLKSHLGRRRRQPRRRGLAWLASTMQGERRDRVDRPRREPEPQHDGAAIHPARREPARHQLDESPGPELRREVWRRLATDMRPPLLKEMCRTIAFSQLPAAFDDFIQGKVNRRIVVDLAE